MLSAAENHENSVGETVKLTQPLAPLLYTYREGEGDESVQTMKKSTYEAAKQLARELRKQQTPAETFLWNRLRNRHFLGNKFLRQHPIFFYYGDREAFFIADFYCREHRLVIELDGKSHEYQKEYDEFRTHIINDLGIKILRFKNEEVQGNFELVFERLKTIFAHS